MEFRQTLMRPGIWAALCLTVVLCQAQTRFYSQADGLPGNLITGVLLDRQGYVWIATDNGLSRFDGHHFRNWTAHPESEDGLKEGYIASLTIDPEGFLWLATDKMGLARFDPLREQFTHFLSDPTQPAGLPSNNLRLVEIDDSNRIWIGDASDGLTQFDPITGSFDRQNFSPSPGSTPALDVSQIVFSDSLTFLVSGGKLLLVKRATTRNTPPSGDSPAFPNVEIRELSGRITHFLGEIPEGWLVGGDGWLRVLPRDPQAPPPSRVFAFPDITPGSVQTRYRVVASLMDYQRGIVFIGTHADGIKVFDWRRGHFLAEENPEIPRLPTRTSVKKLFRAKDGTLWIATTAGLYTYAPPQNAFDLHNTAGSDSSADYIWRISSGREDALWLATMNGVVKVPQHGAPQRWTYPEQYNRQPGRQAALCVREDRHGNIWFGTYGAGLMHLNPGTGKIHNFKPQKENPASLPNSNVYSLLIDQQNRLWVGTHDGLALCENPPAAVGREALFERLQNDPADSHSLLGKQITVISEMEGDRGHLLWVASYSGGLQILEINSRRFYRWPHDLSRPNAVFPAIGGIVPENAGQTSDPRVLWIATEDGLFRLTLKPDFRPEFPGTYFDKGLLPGEVQRFGEAQGVEALLADVVVDPVGTLWVGAGSSLLQIRPGPFTIRKLDQNTGFPAVSLNPSAALSKPNGEIWWGTNRGLLRVDPNRLPVPEGIPPVAVSGFRVFNQPGTSILSETASDLFRENGQLNLDWRQNVFSLEYAVLDFRNPENHLYRVWLEGFHSSWQDMGNRHIVDFTNLDPGHYRFRVQGAGTNGVWGETRQALDIYIAPPFWGTWWFRLLAILIAAGLGYTFYRLRRQQQLVLRKTRFQIARDLHDEVSATLSSLSFFSEAIRNNPRGDNSEFLDLIRSGAREARESIGEIVWTISPDQDQWADLLTRMRRFASDLLASRDISAELHFPVKTPRKNLSGEQQREIWRIFKEILNNAVRHSGGSRVLVEAEFAPGTFILKIEDDGSGFDENAVMLGNGLNSIRLRAGRLNGKLILKTAPGMGCQWTLSVPLK